MCCARRLERWVRSHERLAAAAIQAGSEWAMSPGNSSRAGTMDEKDALHAAASRRDDRRSRQEFSTRPMTRWRSKRRVGGISTGGVITVGGGVGGVSPGGAMAVGQPVSLAARFRRRPQAARGVAHAAPGQWGGACEGPPNRGRIGRPAVWRQSWQSLRSRMVVRSDDSQPRLGIDNPSPRPAQKAEQRFLTPVTFFFWHTHRRETCSTPLKLGDRSLTITGSAVLPS